MSRDKITYNRKKLSEDIAAGGGIPPTNNVGSGNLAGMGVRGAVNQEPGVSVKAQKRRYSKTKSPILFPQMMKRSMPNNISEDCDMFAGSVVIEVSPGVFHNAKWEKRKGKHWRKYLDEDDCFAEIREFASKNKKTGIILRNENTKEMMYAKYPKKG